MSALLDVIWALRKNAQIYALDVGIIGG